VAISFYLRLASSFLRKVIVMKQTTKKNISERKSILGFYLIKKIRKSLSQFSFAFSQSILNESQYKTRWFLTLIFSKELPTG
jgi:hypothetical protein